MKKIWIMFLLNMLNTMLKAQINLVPNPSFEDTMSCPFGISQIDKAMGWSSYKLTPDYLNSCTNSQVGVPFNLFGYQYARTGSAYAGLYSFSRFTSSYREIIGIQLLHPLTIGHSYYVAFFVSRGFNSDPGININIATNKLGARFSTVSYSYLNAVSVDNFAQVYTNSVISDTLNWIEISGFFIADSAYQYLSIGNFFTDSATTRVRLDPNAALAYYYIDDILVTDSTATNIIENYLSGSINVYPNLFQDELIIEGSNIKSISIYDAGGRKCIEHTSKTSLKKINVSRLIRGMYFIRVNTTDKSFIRKIIKL